MDTIAKAEAGDWRMELSPEARIRITNKIMKTLEKHCPTCTPDSSNELRRIAARYEEMAFASAATNVVCIFTEIIGVSQFTRVQQHFIDIMLTRRNVLKLHYTCSPLNNEQVRIYKDNFSEDVIDKVEERHAPTINAAASNTTIMTGLEKTEAGDWRTEILPEARIRITNKITGTLKCLLPCSDESNECQKIAARFEEKVSALAISQVKAKHAPIVNPGVSNTMATTEVENLLAILTIDDDATLPQET